MEFPFELTKFFAGLGLFLFGITLIEQSLRHLTGRSFKKLLRKHTNNHFKSILVGIFSTSILQSSSAVTLMLLAFVGSGVIEFSNALGIIIGANLGTTFTGWVVSTFGFEVHIDDQVLPLIAIGTLTYVFFKKRKLLAEWGKLIASIGLLFFGLSYMKDSMATFGTSFDLASIAQYNYLIFALAGLIFTTIVQSSSATMVIALTTLNAELITLKAAAAFIVGADLGTTITVILGSLGGSAEKKQVAGAHFLFNLITDVVALLALPILLGFAIYIVGEDHPLFALVLFHSSFNLLGIFMFWPFLGKFADTLKKFFKEREVENPFQELDPMQTEAAIEFLRMKAKQHILKAMNLNLSVLMPTEDSLSIKGLWNLIREDDYDVQYNKLKTLEGQMILFASKVQPHATAEEQFAEITQVLLGMRHGAMAAKSIKDIRHNLKELRSTSSDAIHNCYIGIAQSYINQCDKIQLDLKDETSSVLFENFATRLNDSNKEYFKNIKTINETISDKKISAQKLPTLYNVNREVYGSSRSLVFAVGNIWLNTYQAEDLNQLPQVSY